MSHKLPAGGREQALLEIAASRVSAHLSNVNDPYESGAYLRVALNLPHDCYFGGVWQQNEDDLGVGGGEIQLITHSLAVPEGLRRAGIARRLASALLHVAIKSETPFIGILESPYSVDIFERLVGAERLTHTLENDGQLLSPHAAREHLVSYDDHEIAVETTFRLDGLNAADFEAPHLIIPPDLELWPTVSQELSQRLMA